MKSASEVAADMLERKDAMIRECYEQREEILKAFVSQHGFYPDEAMQVSRPDGSWLVVKIEKVDVTKLRRALILNRIAKEKPSLWQKFCVWMAGY
jgi:hypothetical protein